jgi:hypothetical protein
MFWPKFTPPTRFEKFVGFLFIFWGGAGLVGMVATAFLWVGYVLYRGVGAIAGAW